MATQSKNLRAMPGDELAARLASAGLEARRAAGVVEAAERELARVAQGGGSADHVLLCGSLFAVAEAMEAFGGAPGEWL